MVIISSACEQSASPDVASTLAPMYTAAAQTLQALSTQVAATPYTPPQIIPSPTDAGIIPQPTVAPTASPVPTQTATLQPAPQAATRCDWIGFVSDVSYPDGSSFAPSTPFTKTWRLRNFGTCTWTTGYSLVFTSGTQMGGLSPKYLLGNVAPGQTVDISVDLTAPATLGHYRGYWMLQNPYGTRFGYGAQANTAFWVDINVVGPNPTITTITADAPDPSTPGQAVAVSVTISGLGAIPTGTVAITGADTTCTITLASGSGSCNVVFNTAGSKTITATYSGDANYASSVGTASHVVTGGVSLTSITLDTPDPSVPGQAVSVSVSVLGLGLTPTGTVTISGAETGCTITLAAGVGSCNAVFNTAGLKTLTATYGGDGNYSGSSGTASHVVNKGATTTTISAHNPNPSAPGAAVTVSVTVSGGGVAATGTVAITGAETNCNITLSGGSGSCSVVFNTLGSRTLTATYAGDVNYLGSSANAGHTVISNSTTTVIATVPNPSTVGQAVTVNVTVSGAGLPTPTGSVTITGADTNCTIPFLVGGSGSCSVVFNTVGVKTLTTTYSGDANYASSSSTANHTVNKGSTTMTISDLPDPSIPGQAVAISVTMSGAGVTPTGIVAITGADSTCNITLASGSGTCSVVFYTIGAKTITATYTGDGNYIASVITTDHTVKNTSTTTITSTVPNPSAVGDAVAVNVTVSGPGVTPTGTVEITSAEANCTIALVGGSGSCVVVFNTSGSGVKTLTATYSGDGNYVGSSGTANHIVQKGTPVITITNVAPEPSAPYEAVVVTVSVWGAGVTPTGQVSITGADTNCTITLVGGVGSCTVVFNTAGLKTITATYNGDINYLSTFTTIGHTVN
jgi:hypothetical protein